MKVKEDTSGRVVRAKLTRLRMSIKDLSRLVGMKPSTMSAKLRLPTTLRIGDVRMIDKVIHFTDEEIVELVRGGNR